MLKIILIIIPLLFINKEINAQFIDLSGNNQDIEQYVAQNPQNWDKSIMYVFYNNEYCSNCAQAMEMIYEIYEQNYSNQLSSFEINYGEDNNYNLEWPLQIVLVRIQDGMARGYIKINNPQFWVDDPSYFTQNITSKINNFLLL